jgi:putative hydrolase of the HAD superfamily
MSPYRAVLFDLFGTLVHFDAAVPAVNVAGTEWRTTMEWLRERVGEELPGVPFDEFLAAVLAVTAEIVRGRPPHFHEVRSEERFRRALERLGRKGRAAEAAAARLCAVHMSHLAGQTSLPAENRFLLQALKGRVKIGLVSNFDHGPTCHAILRHEGIADLFDATLVSVDFGRRKPHPAIFHEALRQLGAAAGEALFVGDTPADDVEGALGAGLDAAWLDAKGRGSYEGVRPPTHRIARLVEVGPLLGVAARF